ncbi:helix-turn-helix transcriptional regulator [Acinetobacter gyllenbergii]|uniref:helix-turn-helix transcriptional regulator n=1 Tax=Acinetobacter gyllenbergii TaxID=134534 RepID=UPI003AF4E6AA
MQGPYLKTSEVGQRYGGVSARTIHRWQETRNFPKPAISYRGGSNLWKVSDIEKWEETQTTTEGTA